MAAPNSETGMCAPVMCFPKVDTFNKNSPLACKLSKHLCLHFFDRSSLACSMPPYVRKMQVVSAAVVILRAYDVFAFCVWCGAKSAF